MTTLRKTLKGIIGATALAGLLGGTSMTAYAADGTLGPTSTGSINLAATVNQLFLMTDVINSDLTFSGAWSGTGDLTDNDAVCI